jgi:hypothetical protein
MGVWLAKEEIGSGGPFNWDIAGAEGAIEVHPQLARQLLDIPGGGFFVVDKPEVKPTQKAESVMAEEPVTEEVAVAEEAPAAEEEVKTTKRRSTKE